MGAAILALVTRHALPLALGGAILLSVTAAWHFRAQRNAARFDAATASRVAEANAATLARATAEHARQLEALTSEAARARIQAARLGANMEAIRRDPSHAAGPAPVLRDAVERLRASRTAGDPAAAAAPP
jgi:precorrin-2 methylase